MATTSNKLSNVQQPVTGTDTSSANLLCVLDGSVKQIPGWLKKINDNTDAINTLRSSVFNMVYPVGSIYISVNATNPSSMFGGTWEQISGRFLVGTGYIQANSTNYFGPQDANTINIPAGEMGGEAWHTLNIDQMPSHDHRSMRWGGSSGNENGYFGVNAGSETSGRQANWYFNYASGAAQAYFKTGFSGGNAAHNNMPPYLSVYMWKRTA